ncbi:flagellar brake protein [Bordetella sp. 2513F-2]
MSERHDDQYALSDPREIAHLLQTARDGRVLVLVRTPQRPTTCVTIILHVDAAREELVIDAAQVPRLNELLAQEEALLFDCSLENVHVSFETTPLRLATHEGQPALYVRLPAEVSRLQRRDAFRVEVPVLDPATCHVLLSGQKRRFAIRDINANGIALLDPEKLLETEPGVAYQGYVDLPGIGSFPLELEVVHHRDDLLPKGGTARRVGCKFVRMPGPTRIRLQSYINMLERAQIARRRGL